MVKQKKNNNKTPLPRVIRKVWIHKGNNNQMLITIPKDAGINPGDYVEVVKV